LGVKKGTITGKIISRLSAVGTRSEGPIYFILPTGEYAKWKEIPVRKKMMRWMKDPILHDLVGEILSLNGEIIETKDTITIDYDEVVHNGTVIPALKHGGKVILTPEEADEGFMKSYGKTRIEKKQH
jgi:hypothetical protein